MLKIQKQILLCRCLRKESQMKLLGSTTSPFVRKVRICAMELSVPLDFELVNVKAPEESFYTLAPVGKIPVLMLESDRAIFESDLICRFLVQSKSNHTIFPAEFDVEFEICLALINSCLDAAAGMIMEGWREQSPDKEMMLKKLSSRLTRCLVTLNSRKDQIETGPKFLSISGLCLLGYLEFRQQVPEWRELVPDLLNWYAEEKTTDIFKATQPS